jgi:hypothetical protein
MLGRNLLEVRYKVASLMGTSNKKLDIARATKHWKKHTSTTVYLHFDTRLPP